MSITRHFLGWDQPGIISAAKYLTKHYLKNQLVDLESVTIVVPGSRAGRRLTELLALEAQALGAFLILPEIITTGRLPELFYTQTLKLTDDFTRIYAWIQAINKSDPNSVKIISSSYNSEATFSSIYKLAEYIDHLYSELAAANLEFIDLAKFCGETHDSFSDQRWSVLAQIQAAYSEVLCSFGLNDLHTARRTALKSNIRFSGEIYLTATVDLSPLVRSFLEKSNTNITALIQAPDNQAAMFDKYGCLEQKAWKNFIIPQLDKQLKIVANYSAQATEIIKFLTQYTPTLRPDQLAISVADNQAKPFIFEKFKELGFQVHDSNGVALSTSPIYFFLLCLQRYLSTHNSIDFGTLLRQQILIDYVTNESKLSAAELLSLYDKFQYTHLQATINLNNTLIKNELSIALSIVFTLLQPLMCKSRSLNFNCQELLLLLEKILAPLQTKQALPASIKLALNELSLLLDSSEKLNFEASAADTLQILLNRIKPLTSEDTASNDSVEFLGWLEMQLDDSPVHIIACLNDNFIPEALTADPFLPNSLREKIGLVDNNQRYARDAYILTTSILARNQTLVLTCRRNQRAENLTASRLMYACSNNDLPKRVLEFYNSETAQVILDEHPPTNHKQALFKTPVTVFPQSKAISVTSLKDYLECPYSFYLKHVLRLEEVNDRKVEMDALDFGNLAHSVFATFARSHAKNSSNAEFIMKELLETLDTLFKEKYGKTALPTLNFQKLQLSHRLRHFANLQAARAKDGWEIAYSEFSLPPAICILKLNNGETVQLVARIDRIDRHPRSNQWAIWDYKTSEKAITPEKAHYSRKGWLDFQLPIYYYLLRSANYEGQIDLGYINLSANLKSIEFRACSWSQQELDQALTEARNIAQSIIENKFWPPRQPISRFSKYNFIISEQLKINSPIL